jgi:hypothetical protein
LLRLPAVVDNAAMSKPYQFSMRRMFAVFVAVALFCSALSLFLKADRYYQEVVLEDGSGRHIVEAFRAAGFVAIGAGIGIIIRRPFTCVAIAFLVCLVRLLLPAVY